MANTKIKKTLSEKIAETHHQERELKKQNNTPSLSARQEDERKQKALDYYNALSEADKLSFDKELKKKKIRDNYIQYLKYIYGDNYKVTRFHSFLAKVLESVVRKIENGEKVRLLLSIPPQHGKGYPVDFPILTTNGWKNHGDLVVGDYVFNDNGEKVKVLGTQKPYFHPCMQITFANGEKQVVTREHLWKVYFEEDKKVGHKHNRKFVPKIIETQELAKILHKCRRSPYVLMNEPLHNDDKKLLIHPYVLGLWLGDGLSLGRDVVCAEKDLPYELMGIGNNEKYEIIKKGKNIFHIRLGEKKFGKASFIINLKHYELHGNKHIPIDYLLSSEEQRWELLRGLMDTDGCCDRRGTCEYVSTNKELAYDVYTLLHSLGIKARIGEYDAKLYGRFISKKYRITFNPNKTDKVFYIERKQERITNKIRFDRQDKFKYFIKSIEEVEDRFVSCITVENGMYLSGKELMPTHNSLTCTETLPSWFMGRNPDLRCILTSYNADIAEKFGDKNRQLVRTYGKDIFGIEISESQDNKTLFNIKDHFGGLFSTGISGALTSNNGALIIVDDPFKNGEEANNENVRNFVWETFCDSVLTRQRGSGNAIIVIHTRWHEDDLIGRILKSPTKDEWVVINIPCVHESGIDRYLGRKVGETLCPELGFDSKWAESMQKTIGKKKWAALYQGKPFLESGELVQRKDIRFYNKKTLPLTFDEIVMSCDLSFGETKSNNDPCCMSVWGRLGGNHYLLKVINKKLTFTQTLERLRYLCGTYPQIKKKLIEKKANGNATIETLNREIGGFVPFDPKSDSKQTRLELCLPYFEAGNIYFPDESVEPEIEELIEQLVRFPKSTHDDFVDTISQYLLNYQYKYEGGRIGTDSSYAKISEAIRGFRI